MLLSTSPSPVRWANIGPGQNPEYRYLLLFVVNSSSLKIYFACLEFFIIHETRVIPRQGVGTDAQTDLIQHGDGVQQRGDP